MRFVTAFARFWYDFIIGDDWKIAVAVVVALAASVALVTAGATAAQVAPVTALLVMATFTTALIIDLRNKD